MTTSREDMIGKIRAKCVEANPEILERSFSAQAIESGYIVSVEDDTIRLADVLLALIAAVDAKHHPHDPEKRDAEYAQGTLRICGKWNLRRDSLDDQTDECITFLHSLLCE